MILGIGSGEVPDYEAPSDHVATMALHELVSIRATKYSNTFISYK